MSLDCESRPDLEIQVPATESGMEAVHSALASYWPTLQLSRGLEDRWQIEFSLAVAEVAANIIQHAQAPDPPMTEFALYFLLYPDHLEARFVDSGLVPKMPDRPSMPSVEIPYEDLGERGRGLALVQMTTDRFEYRRTPAGENIWVIEKKFPA